MRGEKDENKDAKRWTKYPESHTQYSHNLYTHTTTIFLTPPPFTPTSKKEKERKKWWGGGEKEIRETREENVHLPLCLVDTSPEPCGTTLYRGYYLNFPPRIIIIPAQVFIYIHSFGDYFVVSLSLFSLISCIIILIAVTWPFSLFWSVSKE